jgi:xanthine dehydrogenase accessory factor
MTDTSTSVFDRVRALVAEQVSVAVGTVIRGDALGAKIMILPDGVEGSLGDPALDADVTAAARELLAAERSETRTFGETEVFFDVYPLAPHLIVFGAVHVAQPLADFAQRLGFRVSVIDARAMLATRERFPNVDELLVAWPDDAYRQIEVGRNSWIAILTHDPKFDEPALLGALQTEARYIGAVGSRTTNADRRERLRQAGVSEADIARIRGPIGLDIGGQTPEEMAISILAEIIAVKYGRGGGALAQTTNGSIRGEAG